jgi:hypothetical protein
VAVADKPSQTPYLRFGETERPIMGPAVEIVGNARGLLRLRRQIDRALKDEDRYPLDDAIYRDEDGEEYQVVVRRAKCREEMRPPVPRVEKSPGRVPWVELALQREQARRAKESQALPAEGAQSSGGGEA